MSGIDEILAWALEEFDPNDFDSFILWYSTISQNFEGNNRLPLDEILDFDERRIMEKAFDKRKSGELKKSIEIQEFIDDEFTPEEIKEEISLDETIKQEIESLQDLQIETQEKIEELKEEIEDSSFEKFVAKPIRNFFKSLFGR